MPVDPFTGHRNSAHLRDQNWIKKTPLDDEFNCLPINPLRKRLLQVDAAARHQVTLRITSPKRAKSPCKLQRSLCLTVPISQFPRWRAFHKVTQPCLMRKSQQCSGGRPIWRLARDSCRLTAWICGLIATLHIVAQTSLIRALQHTIGICLTTMIWPKSWRNLCSAAPRAICHVETVRLARAAHRLGPCAPCNPTQASTALSDR